MLYRAIRTPYMTDINNTAIHMAGQQQEASGTQHRFPTVINNTKVSVLL